MEDVLSSKPEKAGASKCFGGPKKMEVVLKAPISGVVAEMLELRTCVHDNALRNGINTGMQYAAARCWLLVKDLNASEEARSQRR